MKALLAILAIVVVGGGIIIAVSGSKKDKNTATPEPTVVKHTPSPTPSGKASRNVVKLTANGFEPKTITIKSGESIFFDNTIRMEIASDPHPSHTNNPELNSTLVAAGKGDLIKLTRKGTFGFHNHLNPAQRGTVIVQ
jgi:plastocyanin